MKILFKAYAICCQNPQGGVQSRIRDLKVRLERAGFIVDYFEEFKTHIADYDVVHCFSLSHENYDLIKYSKSLGKKVIISAISTTKNGWKINITRVLSQYYKGLVIKKTIEILNMVDFIIVETTDEGEFLKKYYHLNPNKVVVIPNGIDYIDDATDEIYNYINESKYILQVGRFDRNKNQLSVIEALKDTGLEIVFIGGEALAEPDYYKKCRAAAKEYSNVHFLGWVDSKSELLKSAYAHADVFVLPSIEETFGLVAIEAGVAGCKLVISNTLPILHYDSFKNAKQINPRSYESIRKSVLDSVKDEKNARQREEFLREFSWDTVIQKHIVLYNII